MLPRLHDSISQILPNGGALYESTTWLRLANVQTSRARCGLPTVEDIYAEGNEGVDSSVEEHDDVKGLHIGPAP